MGCVRVDNSRSDAMSHRCAVMQVKHSMWRVHCGGLFSMPTKALRLPEESVKILENVSLDKIAMRNQYDR